MNSFTIDANGFLNQNIQAFYHTDFYGYGRQNNPDYLNILKNDNHQNWSALQLNNAANQLRNVLTAELPDILPSLRLNTLTVCVVPRAKAENVYRANQMLFKSTTQLVVNQLQGFENGTHFISRHTNTKTTHLRRPMEGFVNDGDVPYPGITTETCNISPNVQGRDILLIDDIYTRSVNIDEDAIQALLNNGANSVFFYAVGQTVANQF